MENRGLLFIPDISGFTRFVNEVEIDHSRIIIQQLLEELIKANDIGLEISEIEGDAILFYQYGEHVDLGSLYKQVEKMFRAFHQYLIVYDNRRICQCQACRSAFNLTLKVVTHYGEFTSLNVQQFKKLIGKDVIVAHQLLKNDIPTHEYWLVTEGLLHNRPPSQFTQWMHWDTSSKPTENGEIPFHYTQLGALLKEITPPPQQNDLSDQVKMVSVSKDYSVDVKTLFFTVVRFEFRHQWYDGLKAIDEVEHFLPGIGSRFRRVLDNGKTEFMYISSFHYDPEGKTIFSETDENKNTSVYFICEKTGEHSSRLTIEIYLQKNLINPDLDSQFDKKQKELELQQSLERLEPILKDIIVPLEF